MSRSPGILLALFASPWLVALSPGVANAAPARAGEVSTPIHWAYAPYFGTGRYDSESEEILALSVKPGWQWRDSSLSEDGRRRLGFRIRVPLSIAVHGFDSDDLISNVDLENISTISAVPGLEIDIPMSERWRLKPMIYAGWGGEINGDESAWIYWAGLMSELAFEHGKIEWHMINGLTGLGFSARGEPSESVFPLLTGFEFRRPLEGHLLGGDRVYLDWHVAYTHYFEDVDFVATREFGGNSVTISNDIELGLAFSKGDRPITLWRLSFDRIGLAYRFDTQGDFSGISLVTKSLFER